MRTSLILAMALAACAASDEVMFENSQATSGKRWADIEQAPPTDYADILAAERVDPLPPWPARKAAQGFDGTQKEAQAELDRWIARLRPDGLVGGGGTGTIDGSIHLDLAMTEADWDQLVARKGWTMPDHFRLSFVHPLIAPAATPAAQEQLRAIPLEPHRTVFQHEALGSGHLFAKDGCLKVRDVGDGSEKLAFFHAETGFDVRDGHLSVINRLTNRMTARVGEHVYYAAPNAFDESWDAAKALRAACGDGEVVNIGNPEAAELFYLRYPLARGAVDASNPPPPPPPPSD